MAVHGRLYDVAVLPALVAVSDNVILGVLTYFIEGDGLEVVSCERSHPDGAWATH